LASKRRIAVSQPPLKVISLARTPERRAEFQRRNPGLAYEFFEAVDGSAMTQAELAATGLFSPEINYTPGAHGVALSHHRLWEEAATGNLALTVAEDDAVFRPDFTAMQTELLAALPPGWDFVLWGFNFDSAISFWLPFGLRTVMGFDASQTRTAIERLRTDNGRPQLQRLEFSFGLPAYTISPAGARRFKAACFPLRGFSRTFPLLPNPVRNFGIDAAMNQVYPLASAHVCFPPLVITPNDRANSTIQAGGATP
jgi:GR25 family glycosyltransferase involved in LPS biosynthesis